MAYNGSNLSVFVSDVGDNALQIFTYTSADAAATVAAAGYITDATLRGMKVNDLVFVVDTATPLITSHRVTAASATSATLSTGVTVGNT